MADLYTKADSLNTEDVHNFDGNNKSEIQISKQIADKAQLSDDPVVYKEDVETDVVTLEFITKDSEAGLTFLNPILQDMERNVKRSTLMLDSINRDLERNRQERRRLRLSSHIPEALQGNGESSDNIMMKLEQLIFFTEVDGSDEVQLIEGLRLPVLEPVGQTSLIANSLMAFLSTLSKSDLNRVLNKINSDCQLWLTRLFRFDDASVMYHDDEVDGLISVCRLALLSSYPKYATDGFDALYSRPPVIYMSAAANQDLDRHLCLKLGLPTSSIRTVPCNTLFGACSKMDVAMLEKLIQDDVAAAKTPVLLLAFAGTPLVGHVDNLQHLQEICKTYNIWLHVEGHHLATLTLFSVPFEVLSAKSGDSLTISPGLWLGIPGLPHIAKLLYDNLDTFSTIKQISREKKDPAKKGECRSLLDVLSKAISALLVFEMASPTVVFRYAQDIAGPGAVVAPYSAKRFVDQSDDFPDDVYYDTLNVWLAESLQMSDPAVPLQTVDVAKEGVCLRYAPLENCQAQGTTKDDVEQFVQSLSMNLIVLDATTKKRKQFQFVVESHANLSLVHIHGWAGLGAVSYIPDVFVGREALSEHELNTVNNLNAEIHHQLKAKDTAFSFGHVDGEKVCIKFGLITEDTDVGELVGMVMASGRSVEESAKFLQSMSKMVCRGIEEANQELEKEHLEKLMQEGLLRQLPMVGSVLNWLSPIKEEVKGRSFNLSSGKIASTQDTYKFHVQVQEDVSCPQSAISAKASSPSSSADTSGLGLVEETPGSFLTAGLVKANLTNEIPEHSISNNSISVASDLKPDGPNQ